MFEYDDWGDNDANKTTLKKQEQIVKANKKAKAKHSKIIKAKNVSFQQRNSGLNPKVTPAPNSSMMVSFVDSDDEGKISKKAKKRLKEKNRRKRLKSLYFDDGSIEAKNNQLTSDSGKSKVGATSVFKKRKLPKCSANHENDVFCTNVCTQFKKSVQNVDDASKDLIIGEESKGKKRKKHRTMTDVSQQKSVIFPQISFDISSCVSKNVRTKRKCQGENISMEHSVNKKVKLTNSNNVLVEGMTAGKVFASDNKPLVHEHLEVNDSYKRRKKKKNSKKNKYKHLVTSKTEVGSAANHQTQMIESQSVQNKNMEGSSATPSNLKISVQKHTQMGKSAVNLKLPKISKSNKCEHDVSVSKQKRAELQIVAKENKSFLKSDMSSGRNKPSGSPKLKSSCQLNKQRLAHALVSVADTPNQNHSREQGPTSQHRGNILFADTEDTLEQEKINLHKKCEARSRVKVHQKPRNLKEQLETELNAAHFRYINEQLYSTSGTEAQRMFAKDHEAFQVYHDGFQSQVARWPVNPLDVIIQSIKVMPSNTTVADFGCGDANLARSVPHKVHSFDLVALNDRVTVCDMAKVPLPDCTVHVAVFCLSLMGTNLSNYLLEANRVLQPGGSLKIAEVASRLPRLINFIVDVEAFGFKLKHKDLSNKMFYLMDFKKVKSLTKDLALPDISLPPCLYKKR